MELKIGEIFKHDGTWCQCVESESDYCIECDLKGDARCLSDYPCRKHKREDEKNVIFKKLSTIGDPFITNSGTRQIYKIYTPLFPDCDTFTIPENIHLTWYGHVVEIED